MESNKLAILTNPLPLKAYPDQEKLNTLIIMGLVPFISNLLSLTDETSAKRLETALPAVREHCWSMGFVEIKKMFELYVDGKLGIEPIPNYFDRILFGKIVAAYKQQLPHKKIEIKNEISKIDIEYIMDEAYDRVYKDFKMNGKITEVCHHLYDHLFEQGKLPKDANYKKRIYKKALVMHQREEIDPSLISRIVNRMPKKEQNEVVNIAKRLVLQDYFSNLKP